ncbi:hypothetical protein B0H14DRAFT_3455592 [Mycena olivaceomarginata]|nr:hypothetical protein B0H14DRAFT_3455592 [Mycena olivaceomarginata]
MPTRYAPLPGRSVQDADDDLDDAFGSDEEDEQAPLNAHVEQPPHHVPGAYDFEREYDCPPPGSPPLASAFARPNDIGNSNGMLPTEPVIPPVPRSSFFRPIPLASGVHGGGIENDGVFANVMAKPQRARTIRTEDGEIHMVPEDHQKEAPPTLSPRTGRRPCMRQGMDLGSDMIIDDLPSGSVWVFLVNMFISFFFQFVGFLLTFLLHTSHAAKYGSRAGLGLTLIQYGFYSRAGGVNDPETDEAPDWPTLTPNAVSAQAEPSSSADVPQPDAGDITLGGVSSRDWLSFLLMTVGWFLLLSSFIGFWRIKRWESSIRASSQPITAEDVERDAAVRRNIESVFGFSFGDEERTERRQQQAPVPVRRDENGTVVVIPTQELLEEARLARDLRAAGLL